MNIKNAVITGGSSGIGLELAKLLSQQNYNIAIISRNPEKLSQAQQQLNASHGKILTIPADVSSDAQMAKAAQIIQQQFGTIDLLILSAGIVTVKTLDDFNSAQELFQDVEVNLKGAMLTIFHFQRLLAKGAKVIFISSGFGLMGAAGYTSYCASKAGLINFAEAWQREVLFRKIKVYVAVPADVDTPMLRKELQDQPLWLKQQSSPRKALPAKTVAKRILKRAKGKKLLIFPSADVYLLYLTRKILPQSIIQWLLNKLFPTPKPENN